MVDVTTVKPNANYLTLSLYWNKSLRKSQFGFVIDNHRHRKEIRKLLTVVMMAETKEKDNCSKDNTLIHYLPKRGGTGCINIVPSTEVQVMSVQNTARKTHTFTHHIILFKPRKRKKAKVHHDFQISKSLSFVIRVHLLHPSPSLFLYGLKLSLWCFSILVCYFFFRYVSKITQITATVPRSLAMDFLQS